MRDKPAEEFPSNPWPLLGSMLVFACGVAIGAMGHWRWGCTIMAGGLALAGVLRLALTDCTAGLLVVRRRWIDVVVLMGLGVVIASLAWVVPAGRPG